MIIINDPGELNDLALYVNPEDLKNQVNGLPFGSIQTVKLLCNAKMTVRTDAGLGQSILCRRCIEPITTDCFIKLFKYIHNPNAIFLDFGAHMGYYSVIASYLNKDLEIHAFEPSPSNLQVLHMNLSKANAIIHEYAVGERTGKAILYSSYSETGNGSLTKDHIADIERLQISFEKAHNIEYKGPRILEISVDCLAVEDLEIDYGRVEVVKIDAEHMSTVILKHVYERVRPGTFFIVEDEDNMRQFIRDKEIMIASYVEYNWIFKKQGSSNES
jgi:FkbM family methyltransferase